MKKRAFSLIEIAIALPLIALLFSFLFLTFTKSVRNSRDLETAENVALETHYFQRRLQQKLNLATKQKKLPEGFLEKKSAQFYFHNGLSLDPKAKGELKAKLFLEEEVLKLHLSKEERGKPIFTREEELLKGVHSLDIDYFFEEAEPNGEVGAAPYKLIHNPEEKKGLTWVGLELHINGENGKKSYFFNLRRPGE